MARYKVLRSVAHNFAHSFVSVMNYSGNDYTMCHLVRRSSLKRRNVFKVNVLARSIEPVDLVTREIAEAVAGYCDNFPRFVTASGAAFDMVDSAQMTLRIRHGKVTGAKDKHLHALIDVHMVITDDRGKEHEGAHTEEYVCGPLR